MTKHVVKIIFFCYFFLLGIIMSGQQLCGTSASSSSIGELGTMSQVSSLPASNAPLYIRIYVHAVSDPDGFGGPTLEQIHESIAVLRADYAEHNIYFVWDCNIIPISDFLLHNFTGTVATPCLDAFDEYSYHPDGIDIFIGGDNALYAATATDIPSRSFIVKGTFSCSNAPDFVVSRSHVISHEMGHCLGLWHTHHSVELQSITDCNGEEWDPNACVELINGSNSDICGDYVIGTPADYRIDVCDSYEDNCNYVTGDLSNPDETLIMSYAHNECMTRITSDQADRIRQIVGTTPFLQARVISPDYITRNVSSNETWTTTNTPNNGDFIIHNELRISNGATLTINNGVIVRFAKDAKVIIEPDAVLNLRGTLTSYSCNSFTWKGVEVWGDNNNQSQYSIGGVVAQGKIIIAGGGKIENAETGIKLYGPTYAHAGGQISTNVATLRNCSVGVEVAPYSNYWPYPFGSTGQPRNYAGIFRRTQFIVDDNYPHDTPFEGFVKMDRVDGISFNGCTFTNEMNIDVSTNTEINDWGYGLYADDSGFKVQPYSSGFTYPPTSSIPCEFNNLGYGIYTKTILTNHPYTVKETVFNNCYVGLRNKSVSMGTIIKNEFNLGELPSDNFITEQSGICFESGVNGFTCQENDFVNVTGTSSFDTYGIFCDNLGDNANLIRKNTFEGLKNGNLIYGQNGAGDNAPYIQGLDFRCNENYNAIEADFKIDSDSPPFPQSSVRKNIGDPNEASGNTFSQGTGHFYNESTYPVFYYYDISQQSQVPINLSAGVVTVTASPNTCPSEYCDPPCMSEMRIQDMKNEYFLNAGDLTNHFEVAEEVDRQLVGQYRTAMDAAAFMIALHEMYNQENYHIDSVLTWIQNMNSISAEIWAARETINANGITSSIDLMEKISLEYPDMPLHMKKDIKRNIEIAEIIGEQSVYELSPDKLSLIENFDDVGGLAEGWAQNILTYYGAHYPPDYPDNSTPEQQLIQYDIDDTQVSNHINYIEVYPNPANEHVSFDSRISTDHKAAMLIITDLNGRVVHRLDQLPDYGTVVWQTDSHPNGIYFYQVVNSTEVLQTGKIVLNN